MLSNPLRRNATVALALLAGSTIAACGGGASSSGTAPAPSRSPTASAPTSPTPTATPAPTPAPPPTPAPLGAPLIVQVENAAAARPQSGLHGADLVYEYETEGGISRFSTFFFTPPATPLGPVRSARLATIQLLRIYQGSLLYSGASQYVVGQLARSGLRSYDESSAAGALFRIGSRYPPHNLYTDAAHATALEQRIGAPSVGYQLWARTDPGALPAGGIPAPRVAVEVSASEVPVFTYDTSAHAYTRTEPGTGLMTDAVTGAPWEPSAVVVLQVPVAIAPEVEDVSGVHGLDHTVVGMGRGQLLVGGLLYDISFTQGASGPPQLTLASGAAAPIPPGQVLVCLVRQGYTARPA